MFIPRAPSPHNSARCAPTVLSGKSYGVINAAESSGSERPFSNWRIRRRVHSPLRPVPPSHGVRRHSPRTVEAHPVHLPRRSLRGKRLHPVPETRNSSPDLHRRRERERPRIHRDLLRLLCPARRDRRRGSNEDRGHEHPITANPPAGRGRIQHVHLHDRPRH